MIYLYVFAFKFLVIIVSPLKELHYANQELMRHRFHLLLQNLFWQEQVRNPILDRLLHYLTQHVHILLEHSLKWSKQNFAIIKKWCEIFDFSFTYSILLVLTLVSQIQDLFFEWRCTEKLLKNFFLDSFRLFSHKSRFWSSITKDEKVNFYPLLIYG